MTAMFTSSDKRVSMEELVTHVQDGDWVAVSKHRIFLIWIWHTPLHFPPCWLRCKWLEKFSAS